MDQRRPTVLLVGQGLTAASALESLLARFLVVGLVRAPSAEGPDPAIATAERNGVRVLADTSLPAVWEAVRDLAPDCVVISSYDRLLPPSLLATCRFVNVHYAPLPAYRGRANVNWAIINGEPDTAITVHVLTASLDGGSILFQRRVRIGDDDTVADLYARLNELQRVHLADAVESHLHGDQGVRQDDAAATYGCSRLPGDGEIDWTGSTQTIYALVRALTAPYPGAFTHLGARRLVVWRARPATSPGRWVGRVPGRVVGLSDEAGWVDVLTGDGVLRLELVQPHGEDAQPAAEVIHSVRTTLGLRPAELLECLRLLLPTAGVP
jgi:methionyl-tRNA formyltransferase